MLIICVREREPAGSRAAAECMCVILPVPLTRCQHTSCPHPSPQVNIREGETCRGMNPASALPCCASIAHCHLAAHGFDVQSCARSGRRTRRGRPRGLPEPAHHIHVTFFFLARCCSGPRATQPSTETAKYRGVHVGACLLEGHGREPAHGPHRHRVSSCHHHANKTNSKKSGMERARTP